MLNSRYQLTYLLMCVCFLAIFRLGQTVRAMVQIYAKNIKPAWIVVNVLVMSVWIAPKQRRSDIIVSHSKLISCVSCILQLYLWLMGE